MFKVYGFASTRLIRWKTDENWRANRNVRCWDRRRQYSAKSEVEQKHYSINNRALA